VLVLAVMRQIFLVFAGFCLGATLHAQQVTKVPGASGAGVDVLAVPYYPFDTSHMEEIGVIKSKKPSKKQHKFDEQLKDATAKALKSGGNIFKITQVQYPRQKGNYRIIGYAYKTGNYDEVKARSIEVAQRKTEKGKYATLTVYHPVYEGGFNDELPFDIIINDTLRLNMAANTKYVIKIANESPLRISADDDNFIQTLPVKRGSNYYIRALRSFPGANRRLKMGDRMVKLRGYEPYFEQIDEAQGDLESSLVNEITVISKKIQ